MKNHEREISVFIEFRSKYLPDNAGALLQFQNLGSCLSAAYVESFFSLKGHITGGIFQKKYLAYSDSLSGINGVHVIVYSVIGGFRISSFQRFSVLGSLESEVHKCAGLGIARVCVIVVDHQTWISAVIIGDCKLLEPDGGICLL